MAAGEINGAFAVANADDFYGQESFAELGGFLTGANVRKPSSITSLVDQGHYPEELWT